MPENLTPIGRTFVSAGIALGDVIDLGLGGQTVVQHIEPSTMRNATIRGTEEAPERLLFETAGHVVVRVAAHDPPGPEGRVNTRFHVLRFSTLNGIVTITGGFSFPLTL